MKYEHKSPGENRRLAAPVLTPREPKRINILFLLQLPSEHKQNILPSRQPSYHLLILQQASKYHKALISSSILITRPPIS